jgi:hypothetical protein
VLPRVLVTDVLRIPVEFPDAYASKLEVRAEQGRARFQTIRGRLRFGKRHHPDRVIEKGL